MRESAETRGGVQERKAAPKLSARARKLRDHRWLRYAIQIAFFILAPGAFAAAFNGVKYVFTQIGAVKALEPTSFVVLLVALLAFTIVFGRFFCGYACAFGTLGDVLYDLFEFVRAKTPMRRVVFPRPLVRALSMVKYAVLAGICIACALGVWSAVSDKSPWVAFAAATNGSLDGIDLIAIVLLALVMVGMVVRERFFCQFLCPLGAVFSLMPILKFSQFTRVKSHCARSCGRCEATCPVTIWPDADSLSAGECLACGRCADTCPMNNVNLVALERTVQRSSDAPDADGKIDGPNKAAGPLRKTPETYRLLRGTEPALVIVRALALLAVLWIVGATRYLPTFSTLFG